MEWVIYLSASQEITVSHALRRNFWWYNNVLWLEDLPASIGVVVGMSGADDITNAQVLFEYVEMCRNKRRAAAALMKTSPSMDSLFGAGGNSLKRGNSVSRKLSSHTSFSTMAKYSNGVNLMRGIEGVLWPGYCHGQILAGGKHLHALSDLVRRNEKFNPY